MNRFDVGTSKNIALVVGLAAAFTPFAFDRVFAATPGKTLNPTQAAVRIPTDVPSMPSPQLGDMPPELQGHGIDPVPQSNRPLPRVVEGASGLEDRRNLLDDADVDAPVTIKLEDGPIAMDYGLGNQNTIYHYSDSLVDVSTVNQYPIRPTGWFVFTTASGASARCTAQLISRSVGVTAGHCVHQGGDKAGIARDKGWVANATFIPAYTNGTAPFGSASVTYLTTTSGWYNTGALDQGYDVGVFTLAKRSGTAVEMGDYTGYYGFCMTNCLQNFWYNTQLGYPGNYYNGVYMTRGEHLEQSDSRDFVFGSGMEGGSSGGAHIANLGYLNSNDGSNGQWPYRNIIMAVTSWGYTDRTLKLQGASSLSGPNDSNNFRGMYNQACTVARQLHGTGSCSLL
jgi:V8-like Glu-specific endopeptidase